MHALELQHLCDEVLKSVLNGGRQCFGLIVLAKNDVTLNERERGANVVFKVRLPTHRIGRFVGVGADPCAVVARIQSVTHGRRVCANDTAHRRAQAISDE